MSLFRVLYRGENHFDFIEGSRKVLMASATIVLISIVALLGRGLNLGIEFEGGVVWEVPSGEATEDDIRNTLTDFGLDGRIQKVTGGTDVFRVRAESATIAQQNDLTAALAETVGVTVNDISRSEVGPSWGDEITNKARTALIWFFILLALYITFRLEWKMAAAALVAVGHDILISVGVYAVFRFEVTPATVIAFLTIMGYSLYDTIVVFDRVKETAGAAEKARTRYTDVVNVSLNQVVMRSIN
ncbi:MAG: protein translocase subunit SecF, partial [Actinomycetota bacterium]|nr:protein translocase subunit SecF [Actinomycetota bacterium]